MCRQEPYCKDTHGCYRERVSCEGALGCLFVATTKASERTSWDSGVAGQWVKSQSCSFYRANTLPISTCRLKSELEKSWRWIFFGLLYLIFVRAIDYTLHFRNKNEAGTFHKICSRTPCLRTSFNSLLLLCLSCRASPSVLGTLFHTVCLILYSFRSMLFVSILSEYLQSPTPGSYSNCIPASLKMASCLFDMLMDSKMILLERPI